MLEQNECPAWFQAELSRIGGLNDYGEPMFRVIWGASAMRISGGHWHGWGTGYREISEGGNSWLLQLWQAPECYGTPFAYYHANRDEATGLQTCGEFPYSGRYLTLFDFAHRQVNNKRMHTTRMPLSSEILDMSVPIIMKALHHNAEKRRTAIKEIKERKRKAEIAEIADTLKDAAPAFGGDVVSFAGQGCRTSLLSKKMHEIEQCWKANWKNEAYRRAKPGLHQV
jgi:hypothetical protein